MIECDECEGEGIIDHDCHECSGSGEGMYDGSTCRVCKGRGYKTYKCEKCNGIGEIEEGDDNEDD